MILISIFRLTNKKTLCMRKKMNDGKYSYSFLITGN